MGKMPKYMKIVEEKGEDGLNSGKSYEKSEE